MKKILPLILLLILISTLYVGGVYASINGLEHGIGVNNTSINAGSISNPYAIRDEADLLCLNNFKNTTYPVVFNITNFINVSNPFIFSYNSDIITINWCEFDRNQSWIIIG